MKDDEVNEGYDKMHILLERNNSEHPPLKPPMRAPLKRPTQPLEQSNREHLDKLLESLYHWDTDHLLDIRITYTRPSTMVILRINYEPYTMEILRITYTTNERPTRLVIESNERCTSSTCPSNGIKGFYSYVYVYMCFILYLYLYFSSGGTEDAEVDAYKSWK